MSLLGEFAGHEFAAVEFALDGVQAVEAEVQVVAGSGATVPTVVQQSLGVEAVGQAQARVPAFARYSTTIIGWSTSRGFIRDSLRENRQTALVGQAQLQAPMQCEQRVEAVAVGEALVVVDAFDGGYRINAEGKADAWTPARAQQLCGVSIDSHADASIWARALAYAEVQAIGVAEARAQMASDVPVMATAVGEAFVWATAANWQRADAALQGQAHLLAYGSVRWGHLPPAHDGVIRPEELRGVIRPEEIRSAVR